MAGTSRKWLHVHAPPSPEVASAQRRPLRAGQIALRPDHAINGFTVFAATMHQQRIDLGDSVTDWIAAHPNVRIVDMTVTQSSDADFHCLALTIAYWEPVG